MSNESFLSSGVVGTSETVEIYSMTWEILIFPGNQVFKDKLWMSKELEKVIRKSEWLIVAEKQGNPGEQRGCRVIK